MLINIKYYISGHKKIPVICACVLAAAIIAFAVKAGGETRVCLDAGHGGSDVGAIGENERYEKDDNLALTLAVREKLEEMGIKTVLTRKNDKFVSLEKRCSIANRKKAALFVSIHRNSAQGAASGFEAWVRRDAPEEDVLLAQTLMAHLESAGISKNRGVKNGTAGDSGGDYHINSGTDMPSCLMEVGFISSDKDNALFDSGLELYAEAIARGIAEYLGE